MGISAGEQKLQVELNIIKDLKNWIKKYVQCATISKKLEESIIMSHEIENVNKKKLQREFCNS